MINPANNRAEMKKKSIINGNIKWGIILLVIINLWEKALHLQTVKV